MNQYLSPGVYVQEVPVAVTAIVGASTSTPGFIGVLPNKIHLIAKNPLVTGQTKWVDFTLNAAPSKAYLITDFSQFTRLFGDLVGDPASAATSDANPSVDIGHRSLAHAVYGFFNNGGSRCYVLRVPSDGDIADGLKQLAAIDEIALVAAPGRTDAATYSALVSHCAATGDRFAILDGPSTTTDLTTLTNTYANGGVAPTNTDLAAWYFPWIAVFDPATKLLAPTGDGSINIPPSGHIAGIYARIDTDRGVHKAPANEVIRGALDVAQRLSKADQDGLNPSGVNCIRILNGNIMAWGARTVGGDANADLKYISVRRTLLFLRQSLESGLQWAVFEPNTPSLWQQIARNVTAFLTTVWRSGALFGTTPQEAFYVKCDAETNPPEIRELGQVVTEVGVAIVRPAEFVIFRLSQLSTPSN